MKITDLDPEIRLNQFAEECIEAAHAALKLSRVFSRSTPVPEEEAMKHLIEEIADVSVCMTALSDIAPQKDVCEVITQKSDRWEERINA